MLWYCDDEVEEKEKKMVWVECILACSISLTVEARISCGQHSSRKLLHTLASLNFNEYRSFAPVETEK